MVQQHQIPDLALLASKPIAAPISLALGDAGSDLDVLSSVKIKQEPGARTSKTATATPVTPPPKRERAFTITPSRSRKSKRRAQRLRSPSIEVVGNTSSFAPPAPTIDLTHSSPLAPAFEPKPWHIKQEPQEKKFIYVGSSPECKPNTTNPPSKPFVKSEPPIRSVEASLGLPLCGEVYAMLDNAIKVVSDCQLCLGYRWKKGQSKYDASGVQRKLVYRCCSYRVHHVTRQPDIDPADYRESKTIKTACNAHVNFNRIGGDSGWRITLADWNHNHLPHVPRGAPVRRPATEDEKAEISRLATNRCQKLSRSHIAAATNFDLEPRQISNIMNEARSNARKEVESVGGNFAAIIASLEQKNLNGESWKYRVKFGENGVVTGLIWMSPLQFDLALRYYDVLLYDSSYSRNSIGYPLGIGIIIDGHACSRNVFYAFSALEDIDHVGWVFHSYISIVQAQPASFLSDRHASIISVVPTIFPAPSRITSIACTIGAQTLTVTFDLL